MKVCTEYVATVDVCVFWRWSPNLLHVLRDSSLENGAAPFSSHFICKSWVFHGEGPGKNSQKSGFGGLSSRKVL